MNSNDTKPASFRFGLSRPFTPEEHKILERMMSATSLRDWEEKVLLSKNEFGSKFSTAWAVAMQLSGVEEAFRRATDNFENMDSLELDEMRKEIALNVFLEDTLI